MAENLNQQQPEDEKKDDIIADYYDEVKEQEKQQHESGIKNARTALYVTAVLVFIGEILGVALTGAELTPLLIGIALVEGGIFAALAYWTRKKPFSAIIVGLILFILLWVANIILAEGASKANGLIFRIIIIVYLVQAIKPAKAWEDLQKR
jgi:FtsH-binding integral membrane protein